MNTVMQTAYLPAKLLVAIVERGKGEAAMAVAKKVGARGGTILLGRGTADDRLLHLLGLDVVEKDVLLTLTEPEAAFPIMEALRTEGSQRKKRGILFCMDVRGMLRHISQTLSEDGRGPSSAGGPQYELSFPSESRSDTTMSESATHELISVIVNVGYADEVMNAARRAGAPGGTVINARGTGKEEDVKFFGMTIVPEKELVLLLVPKERCEEILEAVMVVPCLARPCMGIAFCMDVERFVSLGSR